MSTGAPPKRWQVDATDVARLGALVALAVMSALLTEFALADIGDDALARRDLYPLHRAGERFLAGDAPYARGGQPFVHPPLALPFVALLAPLSLQTAFLVVGVLGAGSTWAALRALAHAARATPRDRTTLGIVGLATPSLFFAAFLGQPSGLYLLGFAGGFAALAVGADVAAGVLAGLLCAKPPLAAGLVLAVLMTRSRRAGLALAATVLALMMLALPAGLEAWLDWLDVAGWWGVTLEHAPGTWWRQWTLYSFVRAAAAEIGVGALAARVVTLVVVLPIGAISLRLAARALVDEGRLRLRAASILALATVALNAYLFYYDALLLAVPAAIAFLLRATYSPRSRALIFALAGLSWLLQLITPLFAQGTVPLPGLVATMWLLVELSDLSRVRRGETSEPA